MKIKVDITSLTINECMGLHNFLLSFYEANQNIPIDVYYYSEGVEVSGE